MNKLRVAKVVFRVRWLKERFYNWINLTFDKVWSVSVEVADWSGVGKRISGYEQAKDFNWTEGLMECLTFHISSMVT